MIMQTKIINVLHSYTQKYISYCKQLAIIRLFHIRTVFQGMYMYYKFCCLCKIFIIKNSLVELFGFAHWRKYVCEMDSWLH